MQKLCSVIVGVSSGYSSKNSKAFLSHLLLSGVSSLIASVEERRMRENAVRRNVAKRGDDFGFIFSSDLIGDRKPLGF